MSITRRTYPPKKTWKRANPRPLSLVQSQKKTPNLGLVKQPVELMEVAKKVGRSVERLISATIERGKLPSRKNLIMQCKEMKKPKIAELTPLLAPALEKAGYIEFSLDKPEMGKDVFIGFSCLDSKSDREDYDSR